MRVYLLCVALVATSACDDDTTPPESVPFVGIDPGVQPKLPELNDAPEPVATSSAEPAPTTQQPKPASGGSRVSGCCAALSLISKSSPIPGQRQNALSASRACVTKASEVEQGSLAVETALSQIRSTLAFPAPGACR
jgi:hypothetical protein